LHCSSLNHEALLSLRTPSVDRKYLLLDFTVALCIANEHMAIAVASLLFLGDCEFFRRHY
jgi:hypothetical protein